MNIELLQQVKAYILAEPRRLDMVQWGAVFNARGRNDAK